MDDKPLCAWCVENDFSEGCDDCHKKEKAPIDKDLLQKVNRHFNYAVDLASILIEKSAREILKADPDLHEFIMAMGSYFFTAKEGGKYDFNTYPDDESFDDYMLNGKGWISDGSMIMPDTDEYHSEFCEMVDDLNEKFNSCGEPMRFTATSQIVRKWGDTQKNPVVYKDQT